MSNGTNSGSRFLPGGTVDMKLVAVTPVADLDRAKRFCGDLGWKSDIDHTFGDDFRVRLSLRSATRPARCVTSRSQAAGCSLRARPRPASPMARKTR